MLVLVSRSLEGEQSLVCREAKEAGARFSLDKLTILVYIHSTRIYLDGGPPDRFGVCGVTDCRIISIYHRLTLSQCLNAAVRVVQFSSVQFSYPVVVGGTFSAVPIHSCPSGASRPDSLLSLSLTLVVKYQSFRAVGCSAACRRHSHSDDL